MGIKYVGWTECRNNYKLFPNGLSYVTSRKSEVLFEGPLENWFGFCVGQQRKHVHINILTFGSLVILMPGVPRVRAWA